MHFGYYRFGANPLDRESMLEQMNVEVLARLRLNATAEPKLLDLGCGLGATLRSFARRLPHARLLGLTRVPWQVEHANALDENAGCGDLRIAYGGVGIECARGRVRALLTARIRTPYGV